MPHPEVPLAPLPVSPRAAADGEAVGLDADAAALEAIGDLELPVRIEFGRTRLLVEDLLRLDAESILELDRRPGDPVDVRVGGRLVARGELVLVADPDGPPGARRIAVRLVELLAPDAGRT